jgi:hypothetical protein
MDLGTGTARLARGLKNLSATWEEVKESWTDRVAQEYEERYILVFEELARATLREMSRLGTVLLQAQQECS